MKEKLFLITKPKSIFIIQIILVVIVVILNLVKFNDRSFIFFLFNWGLLIPLLILSSLFSLINIFKEKSFFTIFSILLILSYLTAFIIKYFSNI